MITMTALAFSFWKITFWYIVASIILLAIWMPKTEEMAGLPPLLIWLILTIAYVIWLIFWLYSHWHQIGGGHLINVVG